MNFLKGKNILVISPEGWGVSKLSKHHYAIELSKSNKVWFLQPAFAKISASDIQDASPITLIQDGREIPGIRRLPVFMQKWYFKKRVAQLHKKARVKFDVVWNFDNSRFYHLDCFSDAFRIHHKMDYHVNYQNELASKSANLCLGVTSGIIDQMSAYNEHCHFIQHGYVIVPKSDVVLPVTNLKTTAVYVGNLLIRFIHWNWIHTLVETNPDVQFYFIGSYGEGNMNPFVDVNALADISALKVKKNVALLGEKSAIEMAAFCEQADILFAAYDAEKYPEITANSHKIMNYIGSGTPVVSNVFQEYFTNDSLLYMARSLEEFLQIFNRIKTDKLTFYSEELVAQRKHFALKNSYERQVERIDALIHNIV